jgi:lactoylglutathione lyase
VNVKQAVPFFGVSNMDASLRFYIDGLGFEMKNKWIDDGKLRWCWLEIGEAALMLQEFQLEGNVGIGVSICFTCEDAIKIYREITARGIAAKRPFVGNRMWVTEVSDPDGYKLFFESSTDAAEETELE